MPEVSEVADTGRLIGNPGLDSSVPNVARIYDALLGGKDNFAIDRGTAQALKAVLPTAGQAARDNQAFLGRVVRYLAIPNRSARLQRGVMQSEPGRAKEDGRHRRSGRA